MTKTNEHCRVTVLVAVYNTAPYLSACLDSLLCQTLADFQAVCVDDGSTDGSPDILKAYQARDPRIEVVTLKANQGQAHARNIALRQARGSYVCFLDSDDWLAPDALEKTVRVFEEHPATGCVLFHTLYYYGASRVKEFSMKPFDKLSGQEAFELSLTWQIHGVYMVRAAIHHRYPYDEQTKAFGDDNVTRLHYLASEEVRCSAGTYYYRQHASSVSHRVSIRRFDYLVANSLMKQTLIDLGASSSLVDVYENHRWLNVIDMYMFYFVHRRALGWVDAAAGLAEIRRAWSTIEPRRLKASCRFKLGYMPMPCSWFLFRVQEELYFSLRRWLKPRSLQPKDGV